MNTPTRSTGTVKWFDNAKGYGFIINESGEDVMVHYRSIQAEGYKTIRDGQAVEFIQTKSEKGLTTTSLEQAQKIVKLISLIRMSLSLISAGYQRKIHN